MQDDREPTDRLMASLYDELRAVAAAYMQREGGAHTLQATALVNEAYLRLAELDRIEWGDRTRFLVAAAGTIRRVLVDHARARGSAKRGGGWQRVTLSDVTPSMPLPEVDVLALEEALLELDRLDARKCRVVELRCFGGLTIDAAARVLDVSTTTVENDWAFARAWLHDRLAEDDAHDG